jgi:ribonuclease E
MKKPAKKAPAKKAPAKKATAKKATTPTAQQKKIAKIGQAYNKAFYSALAGHEVTAAEVQTARVRAKVAARKAK